MDIYVFQIILPGSFDYYLITRAGAALLRQGNTLNPAEVLSGY